MKNLILVSGDIIENANKYNIEAIVNPANKYMDYGSGVCGAIYDKAGIEQLENYCHNKWNKDMEVNEIRITTGFALLKDIIHIYAPRYYEEQQPIEKLKEGYLKLFEVIIKEGYKSVIIPSLGTGFHCYTHEEVAEMVINLLNEFCKNNDVKIIFDLVDDETKAIYEQYIYNDKSIKMNNKNDKRLPSTNELKEVFEELSETMKEELLKEEELSSQILEEKEDDFISIKEGLNDTFIRLKELENSKNGMTGISTGFCDLDYAIKGLNNSNLIVIGSRPAMGKTALALNIATHVATKENIPVAIFSLEMSKEQMANRILCSEAMVDSAKVRTGKIDDEEWGKLAAASGELSEAGIYIDDTPGISVMEIRAKCRKMKLEKNIGLVVIDYLQLVQGSNRKGGSREQEIAEISRSLKILAKEINVPVIALSQLSRAPEQRVDHRPMLSDLRESGSIEQDADIVMFLYRDDYYNEDTDKKNIAEVIIAKHRSGATGTVELLWLGNYTKFANIDRYRE